MTSVAAARSALDRNDFVEALAALADAEESPEVLELRAAAAYGAGELEASISAWERLYAVQEAAGEPEAAARAAALVALNLLCETGLMAPVRAWSARARRLVEDSPLGPVHALLAIVTTYERFLSGDPAAAMAPAQEAVELGTVHGVDPARGLGRVAVARLTIHAGDVDTGIALLDELAVDLGAGQFDPLTTGNVYCELICAALWLGRHDRAREWTEVMDRWRQGPAFGATHGRCRVHRAELLRVSGPGADAEEEALAACEELRPWMRREFGWPLVELGNIRLRRGDLVGAEEAFLEAHGHAWTAQPGLALVRLAQGDHAAATAMVQSEIEHPTDLPWKERPPFGDLRLVPLLAARSEIAAASGDAETAGAAAEALVSIQARYPSPGVRAEAALARARSALLKDAPDAAIAAARDAVAQWSELDAPYDAASARVVLGHAHRATGNETLALMEWGSARTAFAAFGAAAQLVLVDALLSGAGPARRDDAAPMSASLVREGDCWRIAHRGSETTVPDLKGVGLLARLLAEPGREHTALDLAGAGIVEPGMPALDDEARASYRRRLAEVEDDLAEAERDHDDARAVLAERDRDYLLAELSGALGLGGRVRLTGGTTERARTSVTRSLRYAIARIAEQDPSLGGHLARAVRTGTCCSYVPDPVAPLAWEVRP
jgi:tetratricopeptide (TPR) repeat protein